MEQRDHSTNSLPHEERLRGRGAVSSLFSEGASGFVYPVRYVWREITPSQDVTDQPAASVLFTVPKKFHKRANKRNLLRRRVKEAYRLQKGLLKCEDRELPSLNIALIYSSKEREEYDRIYRAVGKILSQIVSEWSSSQAE
ncbi:MAG: ribonuclease P protein component [Rikenellaceae bacterium]